MVPCVGGPAAATKTPRLGTREGGHRRRRCLVPCLERDAFAHTAVRNERNIDVLRRIERRCPCCFGVGRNVPTDAGLGASEDKHSGC
jgi:hypothetical protein